ncbi:MAG: MBL fold metallo-hydrolase [Calditrichaeota bacterium]|nr:MAG: MBL fold metallo-hydrolase [Calditrichota bacterium]
MSQELKLHFLGTGTISPDPERSCSCVLLQTPKENILIDIGAGSLRRMAIEGIDVNSIHYIFVTHFHPDHVSDLIPFLFALHNARNEQGQLLRVWGPPGLFRFIQSMERAYGKWVQYSTDMVKFYEMKRRLLDFPGFRLIWNKVIHTQESVGLRFEVANHVVAFSGDSGYCQELIRLCKEADIAVLECSHADEFAVKGHLSPSLAAKIAEEAAVKKLILTHFYPDALNSNLLEIAQKYYSGEVVLASDGDSYSIPLD